jgi:hypothetical protein
LKKKKSSPKPKLTTSKKSKTTTLEPKMAELEEGAPSTPSATEVEEILKGNDRILTYQAAKSPGARTDKAFTEKGRAFGSEEGDWAKKVKNCYCYAST